MSVPDGRRLGPYEIRAPLGAGGMGEVYRAEDTRLEREVAIKVLPERLADDQAALARFEREAKAVAALSHPNILAVYDVGTEQGVSFVVTELLEGETLRERLHGSALPWRKAIEIGAA
jgi:serine/threonine protein kinase